METNRNCSVVTWLATSILDQKVIPFIASVLWRQKEKDKSGDLEKRRNRNQHSMNLRVKFYAVFKRLLQSFKAHSELVFLS